MNYIVEVRGWDRVKVGSWNSSAAELRTRYITPYGKDLVIHTFKCANPDLLDHYFKIEFETSQVCKELFARKELEDYKFFFETNKSRVQEIEELYHPEPFHPPVDLFWVD